MKSYPKLVSFILTVCMVIAGTTNVSAKENTTSSSSNLQKLADTANTENSSYTMTVGDTKDISAKQAKYYSVKGKDVIQVTKSGKTLIIEAVSEGEATITLKNSKKKVITRIYITVESDELIEDTDDSDIIPSVTPTPDQNVQPTQASSQNVEGSNKPQYNGVIYLTVGEMTPITQMNSISENGETNTIDVSMANGYIAAVNNSETVSATIINSTLYITLKKTGDPYVIVADAEGKAIYRIHVFTATNGIN